ncbi:MAG: XTP/dITP diphosphatase [Bacilli bacterium]
MKSIVVATGNKGKVAEFERMLSPLGYTVKSMADFPELCEVEETGKTFEENATLKSETIAKVLRCPVIADDSGLCVDALDGAPGVYSARFSGEPKDDGRNNALLLERLVGVSDANRSARFVCVLAYSEPDGETHLFRGECEGHIAHHVSGEHGFGYDPIFIAASNGEVMATLSPEIKNQISHRRQALDKFMNWMKAGGVEI